MITENIALKSFKFVLKEFVLDILYWPIWWYTTGVKRSLINVLNFVRQGNQELALTIWIKNLFVPMFGQNDWQGKIISFFMRLFQIIIRFIILLFWLAFALILFLIWIFLPLILVFMLLYNTGIIPISIFQL